MEGQRWLTVVLLLLAAAHAVDASAADQLRPAPPAGEEPASRTCLPLGGLLVPETIRKRTRDRLEVTEPLGDNLYRVTRCNLKGVLVRSMLVEPVEDPDGRPVLAPGTIVEGRVVRTMDYGDPDDPRWAKSWRQVREKVAASVLPPTEGEPKPDPAYDPDNATWTSDTARAAAVGPCLDPAYIKNGPTWPQHEYTWRWKSSSFAGNLTTRNSLKAAHNAWDLTFNSCNLADITTITAHYAGTTSASAGVFEGIGAVDKGSVNALGCTGAVACTFWQFLGNDILETDTRFASNVTWSNTGAAGAYDYRSVGTHEFGHGIGLADLYNNANLTMHYQSFIGSKKARTLGRGDVRGLRKIYP